MKASTSCMNTTKTLSNRTKKIGRPINCFLAYRLEKHHEISSQSPDLNHRDISKIIAKWWKEAPESEKAHYRAIADKAKADHAKKYPNYKYQPVKRSERNVRPYHRREDALTREKKANAKRQLLKQWLGEDDDCESQTSSSSSMSACSMNPQPYYEYTPIKLESTPLDVSYFSSSSTSPVYHPMFQENLICDNNIKFSDTIPDCALGSTQIVPTNNMILDFSSLFSVDTPNYVNLEMLSMNNSFFML